MDITKLTSLLTIQNGNAEDGTDDIFIQLGWHIIAYIYQDDGEWCVDSSELTDGPYHTILHGRATKEDAFNAFVEYLAKT